MTDTDMLYLHDDSDSDVPFLHPINAAHQQRNLFSIERQRTSFSPRFLSGIFKCQHKERNFAAGTYVF